MQRAFQGGLDTRVRFDLGSDEGERRTAREAEYDLAAGPTVSYVLDDIAVAQSGLSGGGYCGRASASCARMTRRRVVDRPRGFPGLRAYYLRTND
jgi:hypothetical protein